MTKNPNRKWTYDPHFGQIRNEDGDSIASIPKGEDETGILIAAAPELLEACEQIAWKLNRNEKIAEYSGPARITRKDATVRMALDAIAKATGETA